MIRVGDKEISQIRPPNLVLDRSSPGPKYFLIFTSLMNAKGYLDINWNFLDIIEIFSMSLNSFPLFFGGIVFPLFWNACKSFPNRLLVLFLLTYSSLSNLDMNPLSVLCITSIFLPLSFKQLPESLLIWITKLYGLTYVLFSSFDIITSNTIITAAVCVTLHLPLSAGWSPRSRIAESKGMCSFSFEREC